MVWDSIRMHHNLMVGRVYGEPYGYKMSVCEQKEARSEETNVHCECYGTICEMLLKHMLHAKKPAAELHADCFHRN